MNIYLTFIIFLILIVITTIILYFVLRKDNSNSPHIDPTPDSGKINCNITNDMSTLTQCDINDINSCSNCANGIYKCTKVDNSNPYSVNINGQEINIKNGNWCLPIRPKTLPCNLNSGYYILSIIDDKPVWSCQCRYPNLFQNMGLGGDCIDETACNAKEGLGHLVCPPDATYCKSGENWVDNPTWDPKNGICSCNSGYKYLDQSDGSVIQKYCVNDTCSPGQTDTTKNTCICPTMTGDSGNRKSYINCPDDIQNKDKCKDKQCIQDPCNPGGYYDKNVGHCVCDNDKNYIRKPTENIIGETCIDACSKLYNQCADRGTCYLSSDMDKDNQPIPKCKDCKTPWRQDSTGQCLLPGLPSGSNCNNDNDCYSGVCKAVPFLHNQCA